MFFWKKSGQKDSYGIKLSLNELEGLLMTLRYWYGIEVDHWINSEASRYSYVMRIYNFQNKTHRSRLSDYFRMAVREAKHLQGSRDPLEKMDFDGTYSDFLGVEINEIENITGKTDRDILDVWRRCGSCRIHYPISNWFFFSDENKYNGCAIELSMIFEPFGEDVPLYPIEMRMQVMAEDTVIVSGFTCCGRNYDDFQFILEGYRVFQEIDKRIIKRYKDGDRDEFHDPTRPGWYLFDCADENESRILHGINQVLGNESMYSENLVKFKMEEVHIPGLISYLRVGRKYRIFKPCTNGVLK